MKQALTAIALGAFLLPALAQMSPIGTWNSIDDKTKEPKAEIRITDGANGLSGRIEKTLRKDADPKATCTECQDERKGQPMVGLEIIRGGKKDADKDTWEGGKILDPENGKEYRNYLYTEYHAVTVTSTRGGVTVDADGSVKEYYAQGGIRREHHVAQIAPADTIRMWAEPETGGEAYIPLAPSKRSRSTAILDEVASRFGYQLVRSFADGGMLRPAPAAPMVIAAPATAAGVDGAALASSIARALGSRPVQVQVLMDGREISAGIRAFNRGLV